MTPIFHLSPLQHFMAIHFYATWPIDGRNCFYLPPNFQRGMEMEMGVACLHKWRQMWNQLHTTNWGPLKTENGNRRKGLTVEGSKKVTELTHLVGPWVLFPRELYLKISD